MHYSTHGSVLRVSVRRLSMHSTLILCANAVKVTSAGVMCITATLLFASVVLQCTMALRVSVNTGNGNVSNTFSVPRLVQ